MADCPDAPLTVSQSDFLIMNNIEIVAPKGELEVIQRCDIDGNNSVDINDIRAISMSRNQPAAHPDDPMDWDKNNWIDVLDARGCQRACSERRCAVSAEPVEEQEDGVLEEAPCFQTEDLDNDGQVDQLVAISEVPVDDGAGSEDETTELSVVVIREVDGETKFFKDSFASESPVGEVNLHLSKQPPGVVDLLPGFVVIDETATVSFENGEPKTLYYWKDGGLRRAPYGVVD